uniref:ZAD domain-containing protein n=1 Tax=Glossina brevipalpis TaxID=37001 RepID=A0A1A9WYQ8_9MUSC
MGSIDKACISGFLCRLCSEMHRIVIHIYGDQGQRLCLVEKINGYLPITISPTDPLPKTICTTCLRRVEQHYDLLMRLSRIKQERFLRDKRCKVYNHIIHLVNSADRQRVMFLDVSSIENSEDEISLTDDESRPRRLTEQTRALYHTTLSTSRSVAVTAAEGNEENDIVASTSARALAVDRSNAESAVQHND